MRHELTAQEIIYAGRAQETRQTWEQAREFAHALYGQAARLTYSQTTFPEEDHRLRTTQALAFDANGRLMPYDFAASWWTGRDIPGDARANALQLTQVGIAQGLGGGLPDELRDELRAFAEATLGVETLHQWVGWNESETLTWMFDLTTPPRVLFAEITDATGERLPDEDIVAAGQERENLHRWSGARAYVYALYGEHAVAADVHQFSRYNDNTYDIDVRLDVYDANHARLYYDLRLPWWKQFGLSEYEITKYEEDEDHDPAKPPDEDYDAARSWDLDMYAQDAIEQLATLLLNVDYIEAPTPWGGDVFRYDLTRKPALRFPQLWAEV